jgi:dTMP kinase
MTTVRQQDVPGKFIAIEGVDGAGKGVQSRLLQARLQQSGLDVVLTREPGGSPGAEEIRHLLVSGAADKWDAMTELLLINAARRDHLLRTIEPALAAGSWVISDRYADSSRAFQGVAGELGLALVDEFHALVTGNRNPHLTLVLDLDPATSLARAHDRDDGVGDGVGDKEDRFEKKGLRYQQRVGEGFRQLAARSPDSHVLIDASGSVEVVAERVWAALVQHFPLLATAKGEA